ncbi:hypothetical protein Tco_1088350 [Tanacetum coccineum]
MTGLPCDSYRPSIKSIDISLHIVVGIANEEIKRAAEKQMQTLVDLTPNEKTKMGCELRLPTLFFKVYLMTSTLFLNHKTKAYDIWHRVKELMEGTKLTMQERKSKLQVNTKFVYHLHPEWSRTRFPDPLALVEKTYNPPSSYASHSSHYNQHLGEGHYAKQCTVKKQVKDSEWFKEKMLLAQKHEAGIELDAEQQDFMADGLEAFNLDCEDL